ncbi:MAG: aldo/keto reductase [Nostoc sp.]
MRYKLFGKSGLRVSELCLGTMTFGEDWGWGAPKDTSRQIFETFVEAGGNFIDTANQYTNGSSEKIVGELIASDRERFVVATKYSLSSQLYTPAGFERSVAMLGEPTQLKNLPPPGWTQPEVPDDQRARLFADIGMRPIAIPDPFRS